MATYRELQSQIQQLQAEAEALRKQEKATVVAQIKQTMLEHGIDLSDLQGRQGRQGPHSTMGTRVAPKYRNAQTGETWTGRGKKPRWLAAELANGRKIADFLIA